MMGGYLFEEYWDFILPPRTLVLVGNTGNGKSATGNSILGMHMFQSKRSSSAVTTTCELNTTALEDDQTLNVIDTPGLFDSSHNIEFVEKEIFNCINMAKDGIDAFLVVISVRSRFSNDEKAAISRLLALFGRKFYDYMIIVFTGGDELEDDDESLEDFLRDSPEELQETLHLCANRCVLFDNKTKDPSKRSNQVQKLLSIVNMVSKNNGGKPYTTEMFTEMKKCTREHDEHHISVFDEQFKRIYEMVESKLKETTLRLEQLLAEEQTARLNAVENARTTQKKLDKKLEKFESKLKETTSKLEQLLAGEQTAQLTTEKNAKAAQKKSDEGILKVNPKLEETMLKLQQQCAENLTALLNAEEKAKAAQKKSDMEIQKQSDPNEQCYTKPSEVESYVNHLVGLIHAYKYAAAFGGAKYEHIDLSAKHKVLSMCLEAEKWLREKKKLQESLPKHADPVLLSSDVRLKAEAINRGCWPIMSKPKPAVPK